ncbi:unnamed protein product [Effrenium voratum]|nr:unnamed protein product [Effrenium voratum]
MEGAAWWEQALAQLAAALRPDERSISADAVLFGVCITSCGKASQWPWALQMLQEMRRWDTPPSSGSHNSVLFACERASAWRHAVALLWEAQALSDLGSFNSVISSCGKGQQWRWSVSLIPRMKDKELMPDEVTWNSLLSALGAAAQWQRAMRLFEEHPTRLACNATISACAGGAAWRQALSLLRTPNAGRPEVGRFNAAMTACVKGRHPRRALRLFGELKAQTAGPDTASFGAALSACEKAAWWSEALALLAQVSPSIVLLNTAASACEKGHQWRWALQMLRQARTAQLRADATTFNAVMAACLRGEQWAKSLALFQGMRPMATLPSFAEALGSLRQAGRWEDALGLLWELPRWDLQTLTAALGALCRGSRWREASLLLDSRITALQPDVVCLLLTLAAADQALLLQRLLQLARLLTRHAVKGDLFGAPATAAHFLALAPGPGEAFGQVADWVEAHAIRALWQVVYVPTLKLFRRGCEVPRAHAWSSMELTPSREAKLSGRVS